MNAYLVIAADVRVLEEIIDYWARYETENLVDVVFAETRGEAKSTFASRHRRDIDFTDITSCRRLVEGVDRTRGIASSNDPIWKSAEDELTRITQAETPARSPAALTGTRPD